MNSFTNPEHGGPDEAFITILALMRFPICVNAFMALEPGGRDEALITILALVRF